MHKIDGAGHVDGQFVTEDAANGRPPTLVTADWLNAVQDELVAVLQAAGIAPDKANNAQLSAAIGALLQRHKRESDPHPGYLRDADFEAWKKTLKDTFSLTDTLLDHRDAFITLQPRFSTLAEAEAFSFSAAEDYAPEGCFAELSPRIPGDAAWFSEPAPKQITNRVSVYADISIGRRPHPSPKAVSKISLLQNQNGTFHSWLMGGPAAYYDRPRLFLGDGRYANFQIMGQAYGVTLYNDLMAIAENAPENFGCGFVRVRVINLGPEIIYLKGFWIIKHLEVSK